MSNQAGSVATAPPQAVHPHAIRWDIDRQLWVCSRGLCDFTRPKRPEEVVPTREEAEEEARRAGTGADFASLKAVSASPSAPSPEPTGAAPTAGA